ncbi:hypothetical protein IEQ34_015248 [Dendrobium chrysotoxum]|uniref:Pesticidal crystal cry8Ba protein n=1 Tax=Dendrobium chrysotoxum TaxID=161865 RepID=A0AAV7GFN6_DENCH|nr:hypothetical protein IEQ34_015248 [Dendrobium chrysotoxum]
MSKVTFIKFRIGWRIGSRFNQLTRTDQVHNIRNDGLDFTIPPPEKFQSGLLTDNAVPLSHKIPVDVSSDTEEEIYGILNSSSPQNIHSQREIPNGATGFARQHHYGSDGYLNLSSSADAVPQSVGQLWKEGRMSDCTNEEEERSSEACGSSSILGRMGIGEGAGLREGTRGGYAADSNSSKVRHSSNESISADKGFPADTPSAPPCHGSNHEINQAMAPATNLTAYDAGHMAAFTNSGSKKTNGDIRYPSVGSETSAPLNEQGPWYSVIAYDACVRLCLHLWARGCMDAPKFLENECSLLRSSFGLQQILLQSEEELLEKRSPEPFEGTVIKQKRIFGKLTVRMSLDIPSGCNLLSLRRPIVKLCLFRHHMSNFQSTFSSRLASLRRVRVLPCMPANSSFSYQSRAYMQGSTQYIKRVPGLHKTRVNSLCNACTCEVVQESYFCLMRVRSLAEEDMIRLQVGSGEKHAFFPDSMEDDLIVEVHDSKGKILGQVVVKLANIAEDPSDKVRWWSIYREPENEFVGRIQLYVNYSTTTNEINSLKCVSVAETVAYDILLEVAMKVQNIQQRNLLLHGPWKWLLTEFASYYGVSDAYTRLRYLSYILDVATPTADCLTLVLDLLAPVLLKTADKKALSHQENRILGEIEVQIEILLALVFENYKALDESLPSGIVEVFQSSTSTPAVALAPAINLYKLLHDILSPEAQLKLCSYFQVAAKKISRRQLSETDEFIESSIKGTSASSNGGPMMETVTLNTAYEKMKNLCLIIRNEIFTDIEINDQHVLPSFVDLKNISASIYSVELCNRLREFLIACPPTSPSPHVVDLVIAAADIQKDLINWNICHVKGGVDAKELFHLYIIIWIQDKRLQLLESCKQAKVIADVEKSVIEALERQYADALAPLKDALSPKKFGLKYVQKLAKRSYLGPYTVHDDLGLLLNSIKRVLDVLHPNVEEHFKAWASYVPAGVNNSVGEHLSEVTVTLRAKFRIYLQAIVEKLVENSHSQSATKLKKIIRYSKDCMAESDIRNRMQPLKDQLVEIIYHLHTIFEMHDVLTCLEYKKNRSWYKSARVTVSILNDTFASQMQQLLANVVQKDMEPPSSIMEVRSVLCKDAPRHRDSNFYY